MSAFGAIQARWHRGPVLTGGASLLLIKMYGTTPGASLPCPHLSSAVKARYSARWTLSPRVARWQSSGMDGKRIHEPRSESDGRRDPLTARWSRLRRAIGLPTLCTMQDMQEDQNGHGAGHIRLELASDESDSAIHEVAMGCHEVCLPVQTTGTAHCMNACSLMY